MNKNETIESYIKVEAETKELLKKHNEVKDRITNELRKVYSNEDIDKNALLKSVDDYKQTYLDFNEKEKRTKNLFDVICKKYDLDDKNFLLFIETYKTIKKLEA